VDATVVGVARIGSTDVLVVTVHRPAVATNTALANVPFGAGVTVVASGLVHAVLAPARPVARVIGAGIAIVAVELLAGYAASIETLVQTGTDVPVRTWAFPGEMLAAAIGQALVSSTGVVIVAVNRCIADASSRSAMVASGAFIVVGALPRFGSIGAAIHRIAAVLGTRIGIIAGHHNARDAASPGALVTRGADAAVITWSLIVAVRAAGHWLAEIVGAWVLVVTGQEPGPDTRPPGALVSGRTWITVIARVLVGRMHTSYQRIAAIRRAWIRIVTINFVA